jgi:hypothetical protein
MKRDEFEEKIAEYQAMTNIGNMRAAGRVIHELFNGLYDMMDGCKCNTAKLDLHKTKVKEVPVVEDVVEVVPAPEPEVAGSLDNTTVDEPVVEPVVADVVPEPEVGSVTEAGSLDDKADHKVDHKVDHKADHKAAKEKDDAPADEDKKPKKK